jgi:transcriptional regulator with XRE-family HTH domain
MEALAVGRLLRELRLRLDWPQSEVARRAGISRSAYSEIERGEMDHVPLGKLRTVGAILEVRLTLEPRWRGAEIDRIVSSRHANMAERLTRLLVDAGWEVKPEVSFNHFGERGIVDLVAWFAPTRTLLLIEIKTEIADVNDLLAVTGRRARLAERIVEPFGWRPAHVAQWLVVAESRTNERRVADHRAMLRAAFPDDGRGVRGWIRRPVRAVAALWFLPDSSASSTRRASAPRLRVRRARPGAPARKDAA